MATNIEPFKIGQSVRILKGLYHMEPVADIYTVLRCNESDSPNPSYVLQNDANQRQRREFHSQLVSAVAGEGAPADPFGRQETE